MQKAWYRPILPHAIAVGLFLDRNLLRQFANNQQPRIRELIRNFLRDLRAESPIDLQRMNADSYREEEEAKTLSI